MDLRLVKAYLEDNYLAGSFDDVQVDGFCYITAEYGSGTEIQGFVSINESFVTVGAKLATSAENHQYEVDELEHEVLELVERFDPIHGIDCVYITKQVAISEMEESDLDQAYDDVFDKVAGLWGVED
ncbi:MAG: hypothetical protein RJA75_18 [Actinomycetota bacterium]|jgi:hypothetical protein